MTNSITSELDDLLVHIIELDQERQTYAVKLTLEDGSNFNGQMSLEGYHIPQLDDASAVAQNGLELFNRLFAGILSDAFHRARAAATARERGLRLRLRLDGKNPRLHSIPWELMHYSLGGGMSAPRPLATDSAIALSRYLESSEPEGKPIERRPLRILLAISAPHDLEAWNLAPILKQAELDDLLDRFAPMMQSGQISVDVLPRVSEQRLHDALEQGYLDRPPAPDWEWGYDALLYYGHGLHHPRLGTRLLLEDESTGEGRLYDDAELVERLRQLNHSPKRLSMAVFVACNTALVHGGTPLDNLAMNLVRAAGVPAVLAMQRLVEIHLARNFTYYLSDELLHNGLIDIAVTTARRRVFQPDTVNWSTPVLYMRNSDGRLFSPNALLEYVKDLLEDQQFARWCDEAFIDLEAVTIPLGQNWRLMVLRPADAPPPNNVRVALRRALLLQHDQGAANIVALIGPPQSGQTTTLQRCVWDLAESVRDDPANNYAIGVYVPLSAYEQQRASGSRLERLIFTVIRERSPALADDVLQLFQTAGNVEYQIHPKARYVFLLDGLDIVPEDLRASASTEIRRLAERLPDQRFVVSCSQNFFPDDLAQDSQVLIVQPLSERQILRYLQQREPGKSAEIFRRIVENRLLDLAAEPALMSHIYDRLSQTQEIEFTRNQILSDVLDHKLSRMKTRYTQGDAARETLLSLAWQLSWSHRDALPLIEVFATMAQARGDRDYNLEELYQALREERLIVDVGQHMVRFAQPMLQSYCTALELYNRSDFNDRLNDIIANCGVSHRMAWWQDTLYALAGMIDDPAPLSPLGLAAISENSGPHTVLLARCLEALSAEAHKRLSEIEAQELIDACALHLRANREPSPMRRQQIATALGRLAYPQAISELKRLLTDKVRFTRNGPRYDYTNVRIAAARGLRTLLAKSRIDIEMVRRARSSNAQPQEKLDERQGPEAPPQLASLQANDGSLLALLQAWADGTSNDLTLLRQVLKNPQTTAPERALAAFALGDLAVSDIDAALLLDIVMRPQPANVPDEDWNDTLWAATDALTLFNADRVAEMLAVLLKRRPKLRDRSVEQITYIAGRVRACDPEVVGWLLDLLIGHADYIIKGKALQSLAWLGKALDTLTLSSIDEPVGLLVKRLCLYLVLWRLDAINLPAPPGPFTFEPAPENDPQSIYLRRKAVEALSWIGNEETVEIIYPQVAGWPLELREEWYVTVSAIRSRPSQMYRYER